MWNDRIIIWYRGAVMVLFQMKTSHYSMFHFFQRDAAADTWKLLNIEHSHLYCAAFTFLSTIVFFIRLFHWGVVIIKACFWVRQQNTEVHSLWLEKSASEKKVPAEWFKTPFWNIWKHKNMEPVWVCCDFLSELKYYLVLFSYNSEALI